MKKWLLNPFIYIAGARALLTGAAALLITTVISYYSYAHLYSVIGMHKGAGFSPYIVYLIEDIMDIVVAALTFYLAGILFSRSKIRLIDVAGTLSMARFPMIVCAALCFFLPPTDVHSLSDLKPIHLIIGFITVPFDIWMIVLMYNAFVTSCNLKGTKAIILFIVGLLIADPLSTFVIHTITHIK